MHYIRPGPMESIPLYAKRKAGQAPVTYEHPSIRANLKRNVWHYCISRTNNANCFQMAGFTFGEADLFRRAVSKKNREVLQNERVHFVQKAIQEGHSDRSCIQPFMI